MSKRLWAALGLIVGLAGSAACAQPAPAVAPNDYTQDANWLCRPGRADACAVDLTATVVAADGATKLEPFKADAKAPIDCFYIYPTVSTDPGGNSDMVIDPAERTVAEQQFARFASVCRPYAPMYRQATLAALRAVMRGQANPSDEALAYGDARDAWNDYLARDNQGRGVVLIGHSQGSIILLKLLKAEVDGKPAQKRMVSALVLGWNTPVDPVARTYGSIPLCAAAGQTGCIVAYTSFRADAPPTPASVFGHVAEAGKADACVNPAALGGGSALLHSYFGARSIAPNNPQPRIWAKGRTIDTPFVAVPGLVSGECVTQNGLTYLAITVHGDPADPRVDDIPGDLMVMGMRVRDWGLHLVDVNLTMGDLVGLVDEQSKAYRTGK
jgi:hypothetical protein